MLSYTSNSNERIPPGRLLRTWVVSGLVALLVLFGWEAFLRPTGVGPSLELSIPAWISIRDQVGPRSTVAIGSSRVLADLHPEAWAAGMDDDRLHHLGIGATSFILALEHFADDESFAGLVLAGVMPAYVFDGSGSSDARIVKTLAAYESTRRSPADWSEARLRHALLRRLVFRNQRASPDLWISALFSGTPPPRPPRIQWRTDRYTPWDHTGQSAGRDRQHWPVHGRPASEPEVDRIVDGIEAGVALIQDRGGTVVLVSFPTCGNRAEYEERWWPRVEYWDRLAAGTSAITIHSADYPGLSGFCRDPQGSHLDEREAIPFTRALARILEGKLDLRSSAGPQGSAGHE